MMSNPIMIVAALLLAGSPAVAREFYRGKTVKILVGSAAGTSYGSFSYSPQTAVE